MKIAPVEIRKYEFKKVLRGYDPDEVRYFLEMIADELEAINREKSELESKVKSHQEKLQEYRQIEKSMQDALIVAKETSDRSMANTKKESKLIIADAEAKADRIVEGARKEASKIRQDIEKLRMQKDSFIVKIKNILRSEFELIDALDKSDTKFEDVDLDTLEDEDSFDLDRLKEEINRLDDDIYRESESDIDLDSDVDLDLDRRQSE
ncbi:MAG: DivIVA domain-containing protein [Candidatus Marinimicrobia bacterium]|nr:DivIVA domain-containing protein [Candidatus Neomarinimicrobiota bacterium]